MECLKELSLWACLWKQAIFCSDFKRAKEISVKKYGLHVERAVKYLVKGSIISILRFF